MVIKDLVIRPYSIPFREEFRTLQKTLSYRKGMIITALSNNGFTGIGDIAPLEGFSRESIEQARIQALSLSEKLRGITVPVDLPSLEELMVSHSNSTDPIPSVLFGFESAIADLASKHAGLPLARWLNRDAVLDVPVNALLTGGPEDIRDEANGKQVFGYNAYKIKVGRGSIDNDRSRIRISRDQLGDKVMIRLDANQAWNFDKATEALDRFSAHKIEFVEEPLQAHLFSRIPELYDICGVDIALDETASQKDWIESLFKIKGVHTLIIKPSVVGGIAKSLALSRRVDELGKRFVFTSLFESGVGLTACLHIAAATGKEIPPCGLDTIGYLEDSLIKEELPVLGGVIEVPRLPGLGVTLKQDFVQK
jgi:O-succinylbenzoate synthase